MFERAATRVVPLDWGSALFHDRLPRHPDLNTVRVEVAGHTDNLGSPASSLPLSERRAAAVKAELVRLGVTADRIVAHGYGQAFPIASNATGAGRIANRRAEIRVVQGN